MIHAGSALAGHYYAYIKCFDNNRWYKFNDSEVKEISEGDITGVYGGPTVNQWGQSVFGANAYLLMYRKIEPGQSMSTDACQVPALILDMIEEAKREEERRAQEALELKMTTKLYIYYKKQAQYVPIRKDRTITELKTLLQSVFDELDSIPLDAFRLRGYQYYRDEYKETFDDETLTLEQAKVMVGKQYVVEVRTPNVPFEPVLPGDLTFCCVPWLPVFDMETSRLDTKIREHTERVSITPTATLEEFVGKLSALFRIPPERLSILSKTLLTLDYKVMQKNDPAYYHAQLNTHRLVGATESTLFLEEAAEP
jgi:hypothetical protein